MSSGLILGLWNLTYWTSYVPEKIAMFVFVCVCVHIHILYCLYTLNTYIYTKKLFFIPLFVCIFIRFVLLDFFLSSLVCSFLLFRTFVMFTYTAVCLNLCSSSFSAGRSRYWTSATFPLVAESSNLSCCWSEADFSGLAAGMIFVLCPDGFQPHQTFTECTFRVDTSYWADSCSVYNFFFSFCLYIHSILCPGQFD